MLSCLDLIPRFYSKLTVYSYMKSLRWTFLWIFMTAWTFAILAYIFMMIFVKNHLKKQVHDAFPPLHIVSSFLWLQDYPDWTSTPLWHTQNKNEEIVSELEWEPVVFDFEENKIRLYSPAHKFVWELTKKARSFTMTYSTWFQQKKKTIDLLWYVDELWVRSVEVWVNNELMEKWTNTYVFEFVDESWNEFRYEKKLTVDYEELDIDGMILYVDPYYTTQQWHNLVWQEDDFDGIPASFITAWCGYDDEFVLLKNDLTFEFLPSCLSFSKQKKYVISFQDRREEPGAFVYRIVSPRHWILHDNFPLFQWKWWNVFQSLAFFNPWGQFLQIVGAFWDKHDFETTIEHYDIRSQRSSMSLRQINHEQLEIQNGYEKLILYYFKDWESRRQVVYPWLRYKYYVIRWGRWKFVRQGTVYHLDQQIRVMPYEEHWSPFRLDAWLQNNEVVVGDPFKHIRYNISALSKPSFIQDNPDTLFDCEETRLWVYNVLWATRRYVYEDEVFTLLWSHWYVDHVWLENSRWETFEINQHVDWYVAIDIPFEKRLWVGVEEYTLIWYDGKNRELCRKVVDVDILEKPF